jgi:hypothetical protein
MSLGEWMNKNSMAVTIAATVVLLGSLLLIVLSSATSESDPTTQATQAYFFDLSTSELFTAEMTLLAPIDAPSGPFKGKPGGVSAFIYSCGQCDPDQWEIRYLRKYSDAAKRLMLQLQEDHPGRAVYMPSDRVATEPFRSGILVKRPEDADWVRQSSPKGTAIVREAIKCGSQLARECRPARP